MRRPRIVVTAALVAAGSLLGLGWSQESSPPSLPDTPPPMVAGDASLPPDLPTPKIPDAVQDPAFDRYVSLELVGQAYASLDPALLTDVALQFLEGERILQRPHRAFGASAMLDLAIRVATSRGDASSLDRIAKAAERHGQKSLAERVGLARQLSARPRSAPPSVNLPVGDLSANQVVDIQELMQRVDRACVMQNVKALKALEDELGSLPIESYPHVGPLMKRVREQVDAADKSGSGEGDELLEKLSSVSRNFSGWRIEKTPRAKWYQTHTSWPDWILVYDPFGGPANTQRWFQKRSYEGLKNRWGTLLVNRTGEVSRRTPQGATVRYKVAMRPNRSGLDLTQIRQSVSLSRPLLFASLGGPGDGFELTSSNEAQFGSVFWSMIDFIRNFGGAGIVAAGGGNASGGGRLTMPIFLIGHDGSTLVGQDGASYRILSTTTTDAKTAVFRKTSTLVE